MAVLGNGSNIAKVKMGLCVFFRAIQGTRCGGSRLSQLEGAHLPQRNVLEFSIHFGKWTNDRARQSVFCAALNPFVQDTEEVLVVLSKITMNHIGPQSG